MSDIRFGDVVLEPEGLRVLKAGAPLSLEPKSVRVLLYLVENRHRVVPKQELIGAVWKDTFVTDNVLTRAVSQIRKALGDDIYLVRYIETVPTVGYRFIAHVEGEEPASPPPARWPWIAGAAIAATTLAVLVTARVRSPAARPFDAPAVQITASLGLDAYPAFSPDGGSLAYSSDRGHHVEIYVRPLSPGGREIQITADGGPNIELSWSPDGKSIAYHSVRKGGIFVVAPMGGFARQIVPAGSRPSWSPDGARIAYQSANSASLVALDYAPVSPSTIWIVPAEGGEPRRVTSPDHPEGRHGSPMWSPDGQLYFLNYTRFNESSFWSTAPDGAPDGAGPRQLAHIKDAHLSAALSPNGKHLYYAAQMPGSDFRIFRVALSGGRPVEIARTGSAIPRDLSVSTQGKLAYSLGGLSSNLWSVAPSGGAPVTITSDTSFRNTHPAFSPDGKNLAWFVRRQGVSGDIWVAAADGREAFPLTTGPQRESLPVWTPDSSGVIHAAKHEGGFRLSVTSIVNGATQPFSPPVNLAAVPNLFAPRREVAFHVSRNGVLNLWKASLDEWKPVQLTFDRESAGYPVWSPDGRWIAFELVRGGGSQLALIPAAGGEVEQLTHTPGESWPWGWSPDGDRIAFAALRDGVWNVRWISRSTRQEKKLTDFASAAGFVRYPAWSPGGDRIVFERVEARGNIYVQ